MNPEDFLQGVMMPIGDDGLIIDDLIKERNLAKKIKITKRLTELENFFWKMISYWKIQLKALFGDKNKDMAINLKMPINKDY